MQLAYPVAGSIDAPLRSFSPEAIFAHSNCITPELASVGLWKSYVTLLDVRTREESTRIRLPFALNVPLQTFPSVQLPIPEHGFVVPFSGSTFRTGVAWFWLKAIGFSKVLALPASIEKLLRYLRPYEIRQRSRGPNGYSKQLPAPEDFASRYPMEEKMSDLNATLKKMTFGYLGSGEHSVSGPELLGLIKSDDAVFLDVRTDEELQFSKYPWAKHIPLHTLPDRIEELPKDKLIIPFCSSIFRASIAWAWFKAKGFENVRTLIISTEEIATLIKPSPLYTQG